MGSEKIRFAKIMQNLESITDNFQRNNGTINNILTNLDSLSNDLSKTEIRATIDNAAQAVRNVEAITTKINNGEGSLGLLLNDDNLYHHLNNASEGLDNLIRDVEERPGKYIRLSIFGRKDTK